MVTCEGKSGLVTGASGGLGRATVLALAGSGANVLAVSRNGDGLTETAALAERLPGSVRTLAADVGDEFAMRSAVHDVERHFGSFDFLVNNAGTQVERDFWTPPTTTGS